jgi:ribosomal protein S18 acetylase RimI-like enzyme
MDISQIHDKQQKREIAADILHDLPDWFGIPESTQRYITQSMDMPFFAALEAAKPVGFVAIREINPYTAEIYVMGVLKEYHRHGAGRALVNEVLKQVKEKGFEFLMVKTLDGSDPDVNYSRTREFYQAVGFKPLECIPEIWGKENPCLLLVQHLG